MCMTRVRIGSSHLSSDELPETRSTPAASLHRFVARILVVRQATSYGQIDGSDVLKMSQANHCPQ